MSRLYSIFDFAVFGLSSAVVFPIVILMVVVAGVAGLVVGLGNWKIRMGLTKIQEPYHAETSRAGGITEYSEFPC